MSTNVVEALRIGEWRVPRHAWLLLGMACVMLVGNRYNVAPLAWVAAVPWLLYIRELSGWRERLLLFAALQLALFVALVKIVTDPLPIWFAFMFSIPVGISAYVLYEVFEALRRRLGDGWGIVLFPSLSVASEWLGSFTSPMGSWGSLAYTQIDNLPFLQLASLTGLTGISALLAATSAVVAALIASAERARYLPALAVVLVLALAAHGFGAVRMAGDISGPMVTVGGVVSELMAGDGSGVDDVAEQDRLFELSREAVGRGAEVVVWNEVATMVSAPLEAALRDRGQRFAHEHGVDLVMAYGVPQGDSGMFSNQYVWFAPEGVLETYLKHHPVPSEPSIAGDDPLVAHQRPYGRAAGAICYDYDFPAMGQAHAGLGAGLVLVPSSDWKGIDPYHTQMASVRGIEGGFSVVRPVRAATSGAYDAFGRARGTMSFWEGERVFVARVPTTRIDTLYSRFGEVVPLLALVCLLAGMGRLLLRRRK